LEEGRLAATVNAKTFFTGGNQRMSFGGTNMKRQREKGENVKENRRKVKEIKKGEQK
jgi:hypothetical protein